MILILQAVFYVGKYEDTCDVRNGVSEITTERNVHFTKCSSHAERILAVTERVALTLAGPNPQ